MATASESVADRGMFCILRSESTPRPRYHPAPSGEPTELAGADRDDAVTISLSTDGENSDILLFPERQVELTREKTKLVIGRASKVQSKGFVAGPHTAWFDNQVMSRNHAEIVTDLDAKVTQPFFSFLLRPCSSSR